MTSKPVNPAPESSQRSEDQPQPTIRRGGRPSRRDEIVRAAADAFASSGFLNTSLNDIAEQLNMTPAGILHHFKLKENLLIAVLEYRDETGTQAARGEDFFENLLTIAGKNTNEPGLTQLFTVLSAESVIEGHPAQDWFRARYRTVRCEAEAAFVKRIGPGADLIPDEIARAASSIVATMDGLQIQWLLEPQTQPMGPSLEDAIQAHLAHLQEAVRVAAERRLQLASQPEAS